MVVVELDALHPLVYLAPLWQRFWQLERPDGPAASDAVAIVRELGIEPRVASAERPGGHWRSPDQQVQLARKRLCLPASRDAEIAEALAALPPATPEVWTIAWPGTALDRAAPDAPPDSPRSSGARGRAVGSRMLRSGGAALIRRRRREPRRVTRRRRRPR